MFALASDLEKSGVGTSLDTLRAHVEFQNERQRYASAEAQLELSHFGLVQLLNLDPHQGLELADEPRFFETPPFDANESLDAAYRARPEMRALEAQTRAAELEKGAARADEGEDVPLWLSDLFDNAREPPCQARSSADPLRRRTRGTRQS